MDYADDALAPILWIPCLSLSRWWVAREQSFGCFFVKWCFFVKMMLFIAHHKSTYFLSTVFCLGSCFLRLHLLVCLPGTSPALDDWWDAMPLMSTQECCSMPVYWAVTVVCRNIVIVSNDADTSKIITDFNRRKRDWFHISLREKNSITKQFANSGRVRKITGVEEFKLYSF